MIEPFLIDADAEFKTHLGSYGNHHGDCGISICDDAMRLLYLQCGNRFHLMDIFRSFIQSILRILAYFF